MSSTHQCACRRLHSLPIQPQDNPQFVLFMSLSVFSKDMRKRICCQGPAFLSDPELPTQATEFWIFSIHTVGQSSGDRERVAPDSSRFSDQVCSKARARRKGRGQVEFGDAVRRYAGRLELLPYPAKRKSGVYMITAPASKPHLTKP